MFLIVTSLSCIEPVRPEQLVYGRGGQKTAMTALVDELRSRPPCRTRSPSMNNEEPIQVTRVENLSPAMGRGIDSKNRDWN